MPRRPTPCPSSARIERTLGTGTAGSARTSIGRSDPSARSLHAPASSASFGAKRHPAFPDAPTLKELGYDVEFYVWAGAFAPAGTPPAVLATLRDAIRKAVATPEFSGAMEKMKSPPAYLDAPEFQQFLAKDIAMQRKAVQAIGKVE